jgi:hypothetical protein
VGHSPAHDKHFFVPALDGGQSNTVSGAQLPARATGFVACSRKRSLSESQPQQIENPKSVYSDSNAFIASRVLRLRQARFIGLGSRTDTVLLCPFVRINLNLHQSAI